MSAVIQEDLVSIERAIPMRRVWAMPDSDTFNVGPIGGLVRWHLSRSKVSIDPFARNKRWATYTNDLNPETAAEYHLEAQDFLSILLKRGVEADLGIFDPPYSPRQVQEVYQGIGRTVTQADTQMIDIRREARNLLGNLVKPDGYVISCGWNSIHFEKGEKKMKVKRTIKQTALGFPMKHAGFTEMIEETAMRRIICRTLLGKLDTEEVDPDSQAVPKNNRPWGSVVAMRNLLETGHIETLSSDYDLIEA